MPNWLHLSHEGHIPVAIWADVTETPIGHFWSNTRWAMENEIKHVELPHKTRMEILTPSAKNSTSREKFRAQAIFTYHRKQLLWQHIYLKVKVTPMQQRVLVNGTYRQGKHRSCSAITTPLDSRSSHTSSHLSKCHRNPDWSLLVQCTLTHGRWNQACWASTQNKDEILTPGAKNSTSRDKFGAQAIFTETQIGHIWSNAHCALEDETKHLEF